MIVKNCFETNDISAAFKPSISWDLHNERKCKDWIKMCSLHCQTKIQPVPKSCVQLEATKLIFNFTLTFETRQCVLVAPAWPVSSRFGFTGRGSNNKQKKLFGVQIRLRKSSNLCLIRPTDVSFSILTIQRSQTRHIHQVEQY